VTGERSETQERAAARRRAWIAGQHAGAHPLRQGLARLLHSLARVRRVLGISAPLLLSAFLLLSLLLRFTVRDRGSAFWAQWFYATPPPVLAGLVLLATAWWAVRRRWRLAVPALVLGLAGLGWTYAVMWAHPPAAAHFVTSAAPGSRPASPRVYRLLSWNVAHGYCGWDNIAARIRDTNADIVALVEAFHFTNKAGLTRDAAYEANRVLMEQQAAYWHTQLPEYAVFPAISGLTLLARCEARSVRPGMLGWDNWTAFGHYLDGEFRLGTQTIHVIAIDIGNAPERSRAAPLAALDNVVAEHADAPLVVVGDFNTPVDSVYLETMRNVCGNAFAEAGRGYAASWPSFLPLLTIDQVWHNAGVEIRHCELGWTRLSDHRPVVTEFLLSADR
jgi:endonuclease/exonuclease/phosphatase (EEP) superfamily protein YafD